MMMNYDFRKTLRSAVVLALLFLTAGSLHEAEAQWSRKWLSVGDLHHEYLSGGSEPETFWANELNYPGILPNTSHSRQKGLWISALNWVGPDGTQWPVRASHIGPRVLGIGEIFDQEHVIVSQFENPVVEVDGLTTFNRPIVVDEVDPNLKPDRIVRTTANTSIGVTFTRTAMQFAQDYHDDYHIVEWVFTNTGNIDDDADVELPEQTLDDVYFVMLSRPTANMNLGSGSNFPGSASWGRWTMNDAVAPGINDQYGVDFRAQFAWLGNTRERNFSTLGNPLMFNLNNNPVRDDTLGRLGAANFVGSATLHADEFAHAPGATAPDDVDQPRLMTYLDNDQSDLTTRSDHNDVNTMLLERDFLYRGSLGQDIAPEGSSPRTWPTHAYLVQPDGDFANQAGDPDRGRAGGWGHVNGYGPYDMAPGEQVRIVYVEGVAGLSPEAAYRIGRAWKLAGMDDSEVIPFDADGDGTISADEQMTKGDWVITARDSLFQLFTRARANIQSGFAIPRPPKPPQSFSVTSGTDKISLSWQPFAGETPAGGWEVYRAAQQYYGVPGAKTVTAQGLGVPDSNRVYQLIAALPAGTTTLEDSNVERGIDYYYYVQAVGDVNTDPTGMTPTGIRLKSSRYWTQTYEPARLRRAPGAQLDDVVVVPNPYILGSEPDVRFPDKQDKIAFYNLPAQATIKIYTEIGELVDTIEHTDGSGDEFWYLLTSSRQLVASGLYLAVITDDATGENVIKKFLVIR